MGFPLIWLVLPWMVTYRLHNRDCILVTLPVYCNSLHGRQSVLPYVGQFQWDSIRGAMATLKQQKWSSMMVE